MNKSGSINLSGGQVEACEKLEAWWLKNPHDRPFLLNGYAGTGKTTAVEHFLKRLGLEQEDVRLLAPTGKAARVLANRTGWETSTIHRELYMPSESRKIIEIKERMKAAETDDEIAQLRKELARLERRGNTVSFNSKGSTTDAKLFIVDESSMLDERVANDLQNLGVPLLLLGDPGQLPPVKGKSGFAGVKADVTLTDILRQDEGSSILRAAEIVRSGERLPETCDWGAFRRVRPKELGDADYAQFDMLLCGTHKVRKAFNRRLRRELIPEADGWIPQEGDRLVCRANNYRRKLMNGQLVQALAEAEPVDDMRATIDIVDDEGVKRHGELVSSLRFQDHYATVPVHRVEYAVELDFAYALTVHSAQGSEWGRIVVLNDWKGKQSREWLYTAITRGASEVVLVG